METQPLHGSATLRWESLRKFLTRVQAGNQYLAQTLGKHSSTGRGEESDFPWDHCLGPWLTPLLHCPGGYRVTWVQNLRGSITSLQEKSVAGSYLKTLHFPKSHMNSRNCSVCVQKTRPNSNTGTKTGSGDLGVGVVCVTQSAEGRFFTNKDLVNVHKCASQPSSCLPHLCLPSSHRVWIIYDMRAPVDVG